jgi:stringent starvation protein B
VSDGPRNPGPLDQAVARLLKHRLGESLARVEIALGRWRAGELGLFEAHAEVLRHANRAEKLAERMGKLGKEAAPGLVREAFDRGLIERDEVVALTGRPPEELPPPSPDRDDPVLPSKRQVVDRLLNDGPVLIHVDARRPEVSVPERFRGDQRLVLRFGYGLTPAIVDLSVDDSSLTGTLSFGGVPHCCVLPWSAIYAVVGESDQKGMVWPDDVPPEVVDGQEAVARTAAASPGTKPRNHLRLVE